MSDSVKALKALAAQEAAKRVQSGMVVGLGTGSTAALAVDAIAQRMRDEGLDIVGIPTSERTAQQAKEGISLLLGRVDHAIHGLDINFLLLVSDIDPTTGAPEVAAVDDGDVEIGWKKFALLEASFVLLNASPPFEAHVPGQLPEETFVSLH